MTSADGRGPADTTGAPLAGIVVVSLEHAVAAPYASRQLADLGATVLKIERPGGDFARHYDSHVGGTSAFFVWANHGKHSVVLDLKQPADAARMAALVAGADVFLHNLSPSAVAGLSLDGATLRERHPGLVICEISGYGPGGPRSDDRAYDLAIQAEAGVFAVTGIEQEMSKAGFSVADIAAGMYALTGVLGALFRRERTGAGALVDARGADRVDVRADLSRGARARASTAHRTPASCDRALWHLPAAGRQRGTDRRATRCGMAATGR